MKKSTTWRLRALGWVRKENVGKTPPWARERTYDNDASGMNAAAVAFRLGLDHVADFQIARLETIVSGPTVLAQRNSRGSTFQRFASTFGPAGPRCYDSNEAAYYRTIIDTREWITRPWADPASAARWHELSEKQQ